MGTEEQMGCSSIIPPVTVLYSTLFYSTRGLEGDVRSCSGCSELGRRPAWATQPVQ